MRNDHLILDYSLNLFRSVRPNWEIQFPYINHHSFIVLHSISVLFTRKLRNSTRSLFTSRPNFCFKRQGAMIQVYLHQSRRPWIRLWRHVTFSPNYIHHLSVQSFLTSRRHHFKSITSAWLDVVKLESCHSRILHSYLIFKFRFRKRQDGQYALRSLLACLVTLYAGPTIFAHIQKYK